MNKMNIKVLSLHNWMMYADDVDECAPNKIKPIMNRDGYYMVDGFCWFEHNGVARTYNAESFKYDLVQFNHRPLTKSVKASIKHLMINKLADKKLKELYYTDNDWHAIRDVYRNSLKTCMRFRRDDEAD